jgi:uncharacterized flavoprotein (TIGR03862 family)
MQKVSIIGGGPSGLMAAETIAASGARVDVYDAMPSVGRKLLMAGKGGLNLTHSEALQPFQTRYGARQAYIAPWLSAFGPQALCAWADGLGIETFTGSSARIFPRDMKAAPLLRAWLRRLRDAGVAFHVRHRWSGWDDNGALQFATPQGTTRDAPQATVLALGGGSWPRLGSDGAWTTLLAARGVDIAPLKPANCGFDCMWSEHLRARYAGQPLKSIAASTIDLSGITHHLLGECILTEQGLEGGVIYALSALLRDAIAAQGATTLYLDLAPGRDAQSLTRALCVSRGKRSLSNHLQQHAGISGIKAILLREVASAADLADGARLAALIKALPLRLTAPRPLDEAISSAGGVTFAALNEGLMLKRLPGVFCAGEMLDWEAPTGGYLLTACMASGRVAGTAVVDWLRAQPAT